MTTIFDVKKHIVHKFAPDIDANELPDDLDLIATGILTSVTTVQLLGWCGRRYKIPINSIAIDPQLLTTAAGIASFIDRNRTDELNETVSD